MVEHGPGLGRDFEAERADAARRLAILQAAERGLEVVMGSPTLNHTFCLHSGALLREGCDNPAKRAFEAMLLRVEQGATGHMPEVLAALVERSLDEGAAVTKQIYRDHEFVTIAGSGVNIPNRFMRNNADPMSDIARARLQARRNIDTLSVDEVVRADRFISGADDLTIDFTITQPEGSEAVEPMENVVARYVRDGLEALPVSPHLQPVFKTYAGKVLADTGHNKPGQNVADVVNEITHPAIFFKEAAFTALLEAYGKTGRTITRQNVGGSQFVTVGSEDSLYPRSFIRHNAVFA